MSQAPSTEREHFEAVLARRGLLYWAERGPAGQFRRERRSALLMAAAGVPERGGRVLEVGCGIGAFTHPMARHTEALFVGFDVAPALVARVKHGASANVEVTAADVEQLPFADATFDAIVGNAVLHHLRLDRAIPALLRVLKPGGRFCFAEPNMLNPQVWLERNVRPIGRWLDNSPGETAFVRWRLRRLLVQLGLDDVRVRPFDFMYPLTPVPLVPFVDRLGRVLERIPLVAEIAGSVFVTARRPSA